MKRSIRYVLAVILIVTMATVVNAASNITDNEGASTAIRGASTNFSDTIVGSDVAQGGNVTELNLSTIQSTEKWQGYYGTVNGTMVLGDAGSIFFNFGSVTVNLVMATLDNNFNFARIGNGTQLAIDDYNETDVTGLLDLLFFNTTNDDPRAHTDSANRTFFESRLPSFGGIASVQYVSMLEDVASANVFNTTILMNGTVNNSNLLLPTDRNAYVFAANVVEGGRDDFRSGAQTSEYELLVPVGTAGSNSNSTTYYFYMDVE